MNDAIDLARLIELGDDAFGSDCADMLRRQYYEIEELKSRLKQAEKENASLKQDAGLLDWLDTQVERHVVYSGYTWQEAGYESDRGLVCMIQSKRDRMSARQAIDTAMQSGNQ